MVELLLLQVSFRLFIFSVLFFKLCIFINNLGNLTITSKLQLNSSVPSAFIIASGCLNVTDSEIIINKRPKPGIEYYFCSLSLSLFYVLCSLFYIIVE